MNNDEIIRKAVEPFIPSEQQAGFFNWLLNSKGSAALIAVAGAGKTTTIKIALTKILPLFKRPINAAYLAFGAKIAKEAKEAIPQNADQVKIWIASFNSFGAWHVKNRIQANHEIDKRKFANHIAPVIGVPDALLSFVESLYDQARNHAWKISDNRADLFNELVDRFDLIDKIQPNDDESDPWDLVPKGISLAKEAIEVGIKLTKEGIIDYCDQLYAPLRLGVRFCSFDYVFVDETQDLNPLQIALCSVIGKQGCRYIFVGDPKQAIYAWRGADSQAVETIKKRFNAVELPLTVSYRCPKAVVAEAQKYVSHIQAHETAPEGSVTRSSAKDWLATASLETCPSNGALLCRNTAPLVEIVFPLIAKGIPATIEGREIGDQLAKLAGKWKRIKSLLALRDKLIEYRQQRTTKLIAAGQEDKAGHLADQVDCLLFLIDKANPDDTVQSLQNKLMSLFTDTDGNKKPVFTLLTCHKSKGREYKTVYWLKPSQYQPSKYAQQDWQLEQEYNLIYVAITRSMDKLIILE